MNKHLLWFSLALALAGSAFAAEPAPAPPANPFLGLMPPPAPVAPAASPAAPEIPSLMPAPILAPPPVAGKPAVERPREAGTQALPGVVLRFESAEIQDILQAVLGDILHVNYMLDPSIQGKITLMTAGQISAADVYNILESVLAMHGVAIVRDGKLYKVVRDPQANREAGFTAAGEGSPLIQVFPLRFVQASGLVAPLRALLGPQALLANDPTNRYLIVVDRARNIDKVRELVAMLDVDYLNKVAVRIVELDKGDATEIAKEMEGLFRTSGLFNYPGTEGAKVWFLPIGRMNAIMVAAVNDAVLAAAEKWIRTLDDEPRNGISSMVHVYPVSNTTAVHLANLLRQLYGGAGTGGSTSGGPPQLQGGAGLQSQSSQGGALGSTLGGGQQQMRGTQSSSTQVGNAQIIADEVTNSLIIRASSHDYQQIRKILERLDTVPRQVLIQVMVAEVTLGDSLQYGVEWWLRNLVVSGNKPFSDGHFRKNAQASLTSGMASPTSIDFNPITGTLASTSGSSTATTTASGTGLTDTASGSATTTSTTAATTTSSGPVTAGGSLAAGLNYLIFNSAKDITGLFNILATATDVNILSAPHVLASDGKTARIEVGSEEPVVTQTTQTLGTTTLATGTTANSVQYRPTGILMEVKPSINASGLVSMTLVQEVSARGGNVEVGGSSYPSFTKRKVATEVTIEEGKTLVVAGLIQERGEKSNQGLPVLKDVPLFGALFGSHKRSSNKSELLITITPYIVRSRDEGERISRDVLDGLADLKKQLGQKSLPLRSEPLAGPQPPPVVVLPQEVTP